MASTTEDPAAFRIAPDRPWLAPLAGWSDLPFRLLCRENGASVCCTEMVSAKGYVYNSNGTRYLVDTNGRDAPLVVQLFGAEAEFIATAARRLADQGFDRFDLNMGCSVRKVSKTCSGAALLRDPDHALRVAEALVRAGGEGRCGFKLRLGWDSPDTWRYLAPRLEALGAGWITLHPRTAAQHFMGNADWTALRELKQLVSIPVVASGDLHSAADGVRCIRETGVDAVMYARGALRNPAVFDEHKRLLRGETVAPPDVAVLQSRILRTAELARTYADEVTSFLKMRTIAPGYIRSQDGAKRLRMAIVACRDWDELDAVVRSMPDILRPSDPGGHDDPGRQKNA